MSLMGNLLGIGNSQQAGGILQMIKNIGDIAQRYKQFSQNPVGSLLQMNPKLQIPQNIMGDPQAVVQYLISSGQMSKEDFEQFGQAANQIQPLLPKF